MIDYGDVLRDHGVGLNKWRKYYRISARKALSFELHNAGGAFSIFAEMLDNGDLLINSRKQGFSTSIMRRLRPDFSEIWSVNLESSNNTFVWLNRTEDCFYYLNETTLGKRRVSDGGLVWSKTVTSVEKYIAGCPTGIFTADTTANKIKKYSLTDGALIWTSVVVAERPNGLKATDDGETFTLGSYSINKVNATGTTASTALNDGRSKNYFEIFSGDNYIWVPNYLGGTVRWTTSGLGQTELIASSAELGSYTNNDYNAGSMAIGKNRIFLPTGGGYAGFVLVFNRWDFSYIDKVPGSGRVLASPNSDNFVAFSSQSNEDSFAVYYRL